METPGINAGIRRICYGEFYRDERTFEVARTLGIEMIHVPSHVAAEPPTDGQ